MALVEFDCPDPGAGRRLGADACRDLATAVRSWTREEPDAVLVRVAADAWHHAPEADDALDQATVATRYQDLTLALLGVPCPVIVHVAGALSGFGAALALAADVSVAASSASFSFGGSPGTALLGGAPALARRMAGGAVLARLSYLADSVPAPDAVAAGLLTAVGTSDDAAAIANRLVQPGEGWRAVKAALTARFRSELADVLRYESWQADIALRRT